MWEGIFLSNALSFTQSYLASLIRQVISVLKGGGNMVELAIKLDDPPNSKI